MSNQIKGGVATGDQVQEIFNLAKAKKFALPAVNVIGSNSINGVLETASKLNAPVIIQFSNGGAVFNAGKGLSNENQNAAIKGAIAGAKHVHELSKAYNVPEILTLSPSTYSKSLHNIFTKVEPVETSPK